MSETNSLVDSLFDYFVGAVNTIPLTRTDTTIRREYQINQRIVDYVHEISDYLGSDSIDTPETTADWILSDTFLEVLRGTPVSTVFRGTTDLEDVKVTLSDSEFEKLPTLNKQQQQQDLCNICMDNYTSDSVATTLPKCKHTFHKECIRNWLCNHKVTCPVCRTDTRGTT